MTKHAVYRDAVLVVLKRLRNFHSKEEVWQARNNWPDVSFAHAMAKSALDEAMRDIEALPTLQPGAGHALDCPMNFSEQTRTCTCATTPHREEEANAKP